MVLFQEGIELSLEQTTDSEADLIRQAQLGDRDAFGELVRRYYDRVVGVLTRMCGDSSLAEDSAQETFLRVWLNLPSFRPEAPLRPWVYRIAINAALDMLRKRREESVELPEMQEIQDPSAGPEAALDKKEQAARVQQALRSLPEASRSVIVLREYGECSYQEIAHALAIPVGTVMSRLSYARNHLRHVLKNLLVFTENENER